MREDYDWFKQELIQAGLVTENSFELDELFSELEKLTENITVSQSK